MFKGLLVVGVAVTALAVAGAARGAVTVIGGGLAEACSQAAMAGEDDPRFQELCTLALDTELMNARDRAGTFVNRGVLKLRRAAYVEATRDFDRAVRLHPDLGEGYVNRGAAYIGQARFTESLTEINRGIELGVEEPHKAYYNRALAHEGLEDAKSAYMDYQQALALAPGWEAPRKELLRFTVTRP